MTNINPTSWPNCHVEAPTHACAQNRRLMAIGKLIARGIEIAFFALQACESDAVQAGAFSSLPPPIMSAPVDSVAMQCLSKCIRQSASDALRHASRWMRVVSIFAAEVSPCNLLARAGEMQSWGNSFFYMKGNKRVNWGGCCRVIVTQM